MTDDKPEDYPISRRQLAKGLGALGALSALGIGALTLEEIREAILGGSSDGAENGNGGGPDSGVYQPDNQAYELDDSDMEGFSDWLAGNGYNNRAEAAENWSEKEGDVNRIEYSDGTPEITAGIHTDSPITTEVDDQTLYRLLEDYASR